METTQELANATAPISLDPSPTFRTSSATKLDLLYEITHTPETSLDQISSTKLPLLNPYSAFTKPPLSPIKRIRQLIKPPQTQVLEYVQASKFNQCPIPATHEEQFIPLLLPSEFPSQWKQQGYTHLHFGAIRLALTYHGRKGIPISARLALLDSRMLEYQYACIGTIETTLNAGTVFITLYPNFNMSLDDKRILNALQVQLQLSGPKQYHDSIEATLHYQMGYRVQNHSIDLLVPDFTGEGTSDALLIKADYCHASTPTCIHIPRQLPRSELVKLLPNTWITNYEKLQQDTKPVQSFEPKFIRSRDGQVTIKFDHSKDKEQETSTSNIFPTLFMMQAMPSTDCLQGNNLNRNYIHSFDGDGQATYYFKDLNGHCFWDIDCDCSSCQSSIQTDYVSDSDSEDEYEPRKKKGSCASSKTIYQRYLDGDPSVGPLGEDTGKWQYIVEYSAKKPIPLPPGKVPKVLPLKKPPTCLPCYRPVQKWQKKPERLPEDRNILSCAQQVESPVTSLPMAPPMFMLKSSDFPPIEPFEINNVSFATTISNPPQGEVSSTGSPLVVSKAEKVLNWQTQNALVQNKALLSVSTKIDNMADRILVAETEMNDKIDAHYEKLEKLLVICQKRLTALETGVAELTLAHNPPKEMEKLRRQIKDLESRLAQPPDLFAAQEFKHISPEPSTLLSMAVFEQPNKPNPSKLTIAELQAKIKKAQAAAKGKEVSTSSRRESVSPQRLSRERSRRTDKEPEDRPETPHLSQMMLQNPIQEMLQYTLQTSHQQEDLPEESEKTFTPIFTNEAYFSDHSDQTFAIICTESDFENTKEDIPSFYSPAQLFMADRNDSSDEDMHADIRPPRTPQQFPQDWMNPPDKGGTRFTIDDIPCAKWPSRFEEFHAWCLQNQQANPLRASIDTLSELASRFRGTLFKWWNLLSEQAQTQLLVLPFPQFFNALHTHFLGNYADIIEAERTEFFKRKCCSFELKDLDRHYKRMFQLFLTLGADNALKPLFLSSIPDTIHDAVDKSIKQQNITLSDMTAGQIQQEVRAAVKDLCQRRELVQNVLQKNLRLDKSCSNREKGFTIKCSGKKECDCPSYKKKKHFRKFKYRSSEDPVSSGKSRRRKSFKKGFRRRKWKRFLRPKRTPKIKSNRCYICNKSGHFAKNCPQRSQRLLALIEKETGCNLENADLESLFSLDDQPSDNTLCCLEGYSDTLTETSDSDQDDLSLYMMQCSPNQLFSVMDTPTQMPILQTSENPSQESPFMAILETSPHVQVQLYTSKYAQPITAIAFLDTGASESIVSPKLIPHEFLEKYERKFTLASGDDFVIKHRTRPLKLRFFPDCEITTRFIVTKAPGKDLIIGWDILRQLPRLRMLPEGLAFKKVFKPYTMIKRLYQLEGSTSTSDDLKKLFSKSFAESHTEFLDRCDHPLWKNQDFFIKLPFKKNEDINPTSASHSGMTPPDLLEANKEIQSLLQHDLIEDSNSQWACEAFYVNKRTEQLRGKRRLVVNYAPLNAFLQDDKFPLPHKNTLLSSLSNAKIFSKFDLKSGFWQLGIAPEDRWKTGFTIPNGHYQWKVMPFGLKTAPSLFQKAMTKIFSPLQSSALIYIDDILLFSSDMTRHRQVLKQFAHILEQYGIMLSEKKCKIAQSEIEFLGMHFKDGSYTPDPHTSHDLLKFTDGPFTKKEVQQFLGIVNYLRSFVPNIAQHTAPLQLQLKKDAKEWTDAQTKAVQYLKKTLQSLHGLHIPSSGTRILQTDASDEYWGAVLIEELPGVSSKPERKICAYASGQFSNAEKHYHSTMKEILAVKYGIKKFEFHLVSHTFIVECDLSSFPAMLQFKQKKIPDSQLLRLAEWFSQYHFTVRHIKGKKNALADFLSRPLKVKAHDIPVMKAMQIFMFTSRIYAPWDPDIPPEISNLSQVSSVLAQAQMLMLHYQLEVFKHYGGIMFPTPYGIPLEAPFALPFMMNPTMMFPSELKWMLWYFVKCHTIAIILPTSDSRNYLYGRQNVAPDAFTQFLLWFAPIPRWLSWFESHTDRRWPHNATIYSIFLLRQDWQTDEQSLISLVNIEDAGCFANEITSSDAFTLQTRLFVDNNLTPPQSYLEFLDRDYSNPYYNDISRSRHQWTMYNMSHWSHSGQQEISFPLCYLTDSDAENQRDKLLPPKKKMRKQGEKDKASSSKDKASSSKGYKVKDKVSFVKDRNQTCCIEEESHLTIEVPSSSPRPSDSSLWNTIGDYIIEDLDLKSEYSISDDDPSISCDNSPKGW